MDLVVHVEFVDRGEGRHRLQILSDGDGDATGLQVTDARASSADPGRQ